MLCTKLKIKTNMKTKALLVLTSTLIILNAIYCTNNKKNPNVILEEKIIIDTSTQAPYSNQATIPTYPDNTIWEFISVNGEIVNDFTHEYTPYIIFSNNSSYVYINSGCNIYIGECYFKQNNEIKIDRISIKDEICPINALEREIVYMLTLCNGYIADSTSLVLFHDDTTIGILHSRKDNFSK